MSLVVEQTLPYTSQQLKLNDPHRWSRLFPLMRPSIKIVETSDGQVVVIDTALSKSQDVLLAAVGNVGNFSSKILSESHLAAFSVGQSGASVVSAEELGKILRESGFHVEKGLVLVRSGSQEGEIRSDNHVLEVSVQGELELDHILSLLLVSEHDVKASFDKTKSLLEHFVKSSTKSTSTFHDKKSGNGPSVIHRDDITEFNSAKKAIDKDLSHLLSSRPSEGEDVVYSVHYSDINGLSRLENNILAHEISQYFANKNLPLHLSHSTIQSPDTLSRGWSISLVPIPATYLSPLPKPTTPLSQTTSSSSTQPTSSYSTAIPLPSPSIIKAIITTGCNKLISSEPTITQYDTLVGDGDCGTTLSSGASFVLSFLSSLPSNSLTPQNLPKSLSTLVQQLEINMGGTSGALYCIFLSSLATHLRSSSHHTFPQVLQAALDELCRFTNARKGDRTMMDCLIPFIETLNLDGGGVDREKGGDVKMALEEARKGVEGTKSMEASLGRSSYLDESATRGVPDPGAYGLLILFEGMVEGLEGGA